MPGVLAPWPAVAPDPVLACENPPMAGGYVEAKVPASKFYGLRSLLSGLLSKQGHWGLRAIRSVLVVAGGLKRAELDLREHGLLTRALRDFTTAEIVPCR